MQIMRGGAYGENVFDSGLPWPRPGTAGAGDQQHQHWHQLLQYVYQQFGNKQIFSPRRRITPGPGRVRTAAIAPGVSILALSTFPFQAACGYVKNVLAYDAYYRHFMGERGLNERL